MTRRKASKPKTWVELGATDRPHRVQGYRPMCCWVLVELHQGQAVGEPVARVSIVAADHGVMMVVEEMGDVLQGIGGWPLYECCDVWSQALEVAQRFRRSRRSIDVDGTKTGFRKREPLEARDSHDPLIQYDPTETEPWHPHPEADNTLAQQVLAQASANFDARYDACRTTTASSTRSRPSPRTSAAPGSTPTTAPSISSSCATVGSASGWPRRGENESKPAAAS